MKRMLPAALSRRRSGIVAVGYGRRFDFKTMQMTDRRLKAKRWHGEAFERQDDLQKDGLEGAREGFEGLR